MLTRRRFLQQSLAATAVFSLPVVMRAADRETALSRDATAPDFANPPRALAPLPWWVWDGGMDLGEMERQIVEIAKSGVRGFLIFGLNGLKLEYLGEEWMDRVRWAVRRAVELGLEPWIYDDFDWPTGLAKDRVIQRTELRQRAVFAESRRVNSPARVSVPVPEGKLIAAAAAPRRNGELSIERTVDLTGQCGPRELEWQVPDGEWDVFVFAERVIEGASFAHYYVDAFNPESTRYFLELTYDAYQRALGPELFKHMRGFFADEAFFLNHNTGTPSETPLASAPWSPVLGEALRMPVPQTLVAVFGDADRFGRGLRREFHATAQRLYAENFYDQRARWCARHGKVLTGHEGGWISGGGDFARTLRHMQMPGMDWLGVARPEYPVRMIEAKVVSSLARHARRLATMEGPGVFSWQQTMRELRQSCDAFALYGFDTFVFNGLHYTVEGKRYNCPGAMFYQSPHWRLMPALVRYCTRLVWALKQGRAPAHVAVLWSPEMVWSNEPATSGQRSPGAKRLRRPEDDWQRGVEAVMSALMAAQVEFGVVDTTTLLEPATVAEGGKLRVGPMEYEIIIVPPTQSLALDVAQKLAVFHAAGGKLIAIGALPAESEEPAHDKPLAALVAKLFGSGATRQDWTAYQTRGGASAAAREVGPRSWFIEAGWKNISEQIAEPLRTTLAPLVPPAWTLAGESAGQIFATERVLADGRFVFLVNASDEACDAGLQLRAPAQIERWNLLSGQTEPWPRQHSATGGTVKLLPREALLLKVRPAAAWQPLTRRIISRRRLPDRWQFKLAAGNASLPIPRWETSQRLVDITHTMAYRYRVRFPVKEKPGRLALLIDNADTRFHSQRVKCDYNCTINAEFAPKLGFNQTFDRRMREFDLTGIVQVGENDLILEYRHCAWLGAPILPLLTLCGTFAVEDGEIIRATERETAAVSWTEFGYAHFSGAAVYAQSFEWQPAPAGARVLLRCAEIRDHARIRLNGQIAAELPWAPWEADITAHLRPGKNDLEIEVINTNSNFVEQQPAPSGLLGAVTLLVEAL